VPEMTFKGHSRSSQCHPS